ncbi:MAG TPA: hypothetical protein VFM25_01810 [Verrucomicrobiae bacterium]|nr:hypothetical protein [Verrucomicrobiae bacterium]
MNDRTPVKANIIRYWRDDRIDQGCVSERTDIPQQSSAAETFENVLLDSGLSLEDAEKASEIFDAFAKKIEFRAACESLRKILWKIADTKTGKTPEFRAILYILTPGETMDKIARDANISAQSLHYHVQKLRAIFEIQDNPTAYVEGDDDAR